jgi:hypothetical protein
LHKIIDQLNKEWVEKVAEREHWKKAMQQGLDDYITMMKEQGLPGEEFLKFATVYLKEHQK